MSVGFNLNTCNTHISMGWTQNKWN